MLIQNRSIYWNGIGLQSSSAGWAISRNQLGYQQTNNLNKYVGEAGISKGASVPSGYRPPYTWGLSMGPTYGSESTQKADISISYGANGTGIISGPEMNAGVNLAIIGDGALHGYGIVPNITGQLILFAQSTLVGSGLIYNPSLAGKIEAAATLIGSGNFDAAIGAISSITITMLGTGAMVGSVMRADAFMSASITPYTALSPQTLAAGVWNALAASYNTSGTMGQKLNAAGTSGDPWTANMSLYNTPGTAGQKLNFINLVEQMNL